MLCPDTERDEYLYYILARHPGRTLVFVNAISSVRRVAAILKLLGACRPSLLQEQQMIAVLSLLHSLCCKGNPA